MALNSQLREILYRVSVHGTVAPKGIPAFHTQNSRTNAVSMVRGFAPELASSEQGHTGFSYTALPTFGTRVHRQVMHAATGASYTEDAQITGGSYTKNLRKALKSQIFSQGNCTKPSCTKLNNSVDVFWIEGVGK